MMKLKIAFTSYYGKQGAKEMYNQIKDINPDLILFFPTIEVASKEEVKETLVELKRKFPKALITGVSIASFKTKEMDAFSASGMCLLAISDKEMTLRYDLLKDVWETPVEDQKRFVLDFIGNKRVTKNDLFLIFGCGPRQPVKKSRLTDTLQKMSLGLIKIPVSSMKKKVIDKIIDTMQKKRIGYPLNYYKVIPHIIEKFGGFVQVMSLDGGYWVKGYEFLDSDLFESKALIPLLIETKNAEFNLISAVPSLDEIEKDDILRKFKDIEWHKNIAYRFDGKSFSDIRKDFPLLAKQRLEEGWIYFFLIKTKMTYYVQPIADMDMLVFHHDLDDTEEVWLIRAPSGKYFKKRLDDMLEQTKNFDFCVHIFHPSSVTYFEDSINGFIEELDATGRDYLSLVGGARVILSDREFYIYPSLLGIKTQ